jgi:hypothetical protein
MKRVPAKAYMQCSKGLTQRHQAKEISKIYFAFNSSLRYFSVPLRLCVKK